MKKIVILAVLFTISTPLIASALDLTSFTSTTTDFNEAYIAATLQLSTDIGTMADRIVYSEELILEMSDRIVKTEALMAQLTVLMAQIAVGDPIDPALAASLQDALATCSE